MNVQTGRLTAANKPGAHRTGADFLAHLRATPHTIFVDGERISDPTDHSAFRQGPKQIASLFDFAFAP